MEIQLPASSAGQSAPGAEIHRPLILPRFSIYQFWNALTALLSYRIPAMGEPRRSRHASAVAPCGVPDVNVYSVERESQYI